MKGTVSIMKKLYIPLLCAIVFLVISLALAGCAAKTDVTSSSMTQNGDRFNLTLPNSCDTFSFEGEFTVNEGAELSIYSDEELTTPVISNTVSLATGNNTFYIKVKNGDAEKLYTAVIRRRPLYTVRFDANDGSEITKQTVEEDSLVTAPSVDPKRIGCTFSGWDHDFSQPLKGSVTITAQYVIDDDMKDFEFVSNAKYCKITGLINKDITVVNVPYKVTEIGERAFRDGSKLTKVTVADSVTSIGDSAFYYCSKLTEVVLGNGITEIGGSAFEGCGALKNVTFGKSLQKIGEGAFSKCRSLTEIIIPEGTTVIEGGAFSECEALTSISLPQSLTTLGSHVFYECISLKSITVPDGIETIGSWTFFECSMLKEVILPDGLTDIGEYAFINCINLAAIDIPQNVVKINFAAFSGCRSLKEIVIPDSVKTIENSAFSGCTSLQKLTIGVGVTSIKHGAFQGCTALEKALFKSPAGWIAEGIPLTLNALSSPTNAAKYLTSTYCNYHWRRTMATTTS